MLMLLLNSAPMIERPNELKGGSLSLELTSGELERVRRWSLLQIEGREDRLKASTFKSVWRRIG